MATDKAQDGDAQGPARHRLPLLVLLASLAVTLALYAGAVRNERTQREARLDRLSQTFGSELSSRVQSYIDTLPGLRVFSVLGQWSNDLAFRQYLEAISLQKRFPGLALTFTAERLRPDTLPGFVAAVRQDRSVLPQGHPEFAVRPAGERAEYMVIRHVHPANLPTFGYDLYDPAASYRREVDAAARSGLYTATPPLLLARDRDKTPRPELTSVVVRLAVYEGGSTPSSVAARDQGLRGVVGVAFRTGELIASVLAPEVAENLYLRIDDGATGGAVFDSVWQGVAAPPGPGRRLTLTVADREWRVEARDRLPPWQLWVNPVPLLILCGGLALSAALSLLMRTLVLAHARAAAMVLSATADLRARQQELAESESLYRLLFENSLDSVLQTRTDGTVIRANPAACAMFGLSEEELRRRGRAGLVDADDPRLQSLLALRAREGRVRGRLTMLRGDGSRFEAEVSGTVYTGHDGQALTSLVIRDVSELRAAEDALRAKELAEQANRAKSEFMARMSHELRTPLNAILGFAQVLQMDPGQPLQPAQRQRVDHIVQAGEHLLTLIEDLLDISRIEAGSLRLRPEQVDVAALSQGVLQELAAQAEPRGIRLGLEAPPEAVVLADRTRLRQVLLNLVSNAIKYNRPAGEVRLRLGLEAEQLWLSVSDTGLGLSEAQLQQLFQPFNRLGRESSGVEGTGIGLVIARSLLELMGGSLAVSSRPGAGSEFTLRLPRPPVTAGAAPVPAARPGYPAGPARGRVLYIDDDETNRLLMEALLGLRPGIELRLAADGPSGLAQAAAWPPDLVLVDLMMPGMSGLEVMRALRQLPGAAPPCIAVSANAMQEDVRAHLQAGFAAFLTKPLDARLLLAELDRLLVQRPATTVG